MITVVREVRSSPDAVLAILADGWTYAAWVVGASRIREVDAAWPAPRARIGHSVGLWPAVLDDETVVERWVPDRGIELLARAWPAGEARIRIEVAPRGDGCVVRMEEDAVSGPGRWIPRPLRAAALTTRNRETLARLALLAERRSSS
ncbi:SRPBCC family protein [Cellulomonas sp. DKR-3]|uniref:SRPBCC family protein n=1 Tax=Cellulomonas fulva TaxID=2835530 RepID=A0ABS5U2E6_9CELL|nr:SRPBCC family protein [Cellulomonas fulva]MBT0995556.1 SRPBCC family protein [Cellulomonas fulva]